MRYREAKALSVPTVGSLAKRHRRPPFNTVSSVLLLRSLARFLQALLELGVIGIGLHEFFEVRDGFVVLFSLGVRRGQANRRCAGTRILLAYFFPQLDGF